MSIKSYCVIGRDMAKDTQIKSFIAVDPECFELLFIPSEQEQKERAELAKKLWQKQFTWPRYLAESAVEASEFELNLIVTEADEPSQRQSLADLFVDAEHGLIVHSCDI